MDESPLRLRNVIQILTCAVFYFWVNNSKHIIYCYKNNIPVYCKNKVMTLSGTELKLN